MRRELAITHRGLVQVQIQEFTADSTLDPAFTSQPFSYTAAEPGGQDTPGAIAIGPNCKIVIVGTHFLDTAVFGVARLHPNGTLDSTFGNGGVLTTRFRARDQATAVLVQPNRDIVAVGNSQGSDPSFSDIALARYLGP